MQYKPQQIQSELAGAVDINIEIAKLIADPQSSFAITQQNINGVTFDVFSHLPLNLSSMYESVSALHHDNEFLIYQDERYSFTDIYQRASALATALQQDYDICIGDKVVIAMRNYPEWMIAFMAITSIGGVAVPLNAWWQLEEFEYGIVHCNAKLVFTDERRFSMLHTFLDQQGIPCVPARLPATTQNSKDGAVQKLANTSLEQLITRYSGCSMPNVTIGPETIASIFYTSGSTGHPKGAVSNHRSILSALNTWTLLGTGAAYANGTAGETPENPPCALMTVPLFHVTACHVLFLLSYFTGRKTVMMHKWEPIEALRLIEAEKVTYFNGVPTMSLELMEHPRVKEFDTSSLLDISSGGAARPAQHVEKLYSTFAQGHASTGYGLTETNALGTVNHGSDYLTRPNSVGTATWPIVQIAIFDDNGQQVAPGIHGEIGIKSISNVVEYFRNEEATAASFIDGYFKTGDLGYLDTDGFVYIVDRVKDIIIRGGENISCLEVEEAIYRHGSIKECSVFALPDARLGEIVSAAIYPKDGMQVDAKAIQAFLAQHLAAFKVPSMVFINDAPLPRLGSGKLNKKLLKQQYSKQICV